MPHRQFAFDWFDSNVKIFKDLDPKSLLYVGHRNTKSWWHDKFCVELGVERIGVIEIFEGNYKDACNQLPEHIVKIHGDVTQIDKHAQQNEWDIIFWDHGPEHCSEERLDERTPLLKDYVGKCLIYCCPWGEWPQKALYGNQWEQHVTSVVPEMFERHDMTVVTFGYENQKSADPGELVGFWIKNT